MIYFEVFWKTLSPLAYWSTSSHFFQTLVKPRTYHDQLWFTFLLCLVFYPEVLDSSVPLKQFSGLSQTISMFQRYFRPRQFSHFKNCLLSHSRFLLIQPFVIKLIQFTQFDKTNDAYQSMKLVNVWGTTNRESFVAFLVEHQTYIPNVRVWWIDPDLI